MYEFLKHGLRQLCLGGLVALAGCSSVAPRAESSPPAPPPPAPPVVVAVPVPAPPPAPADPVDEAGRQLLQWQGAVRQLAPDTLPALAARLAAEPSSTPGSVHLALVWLHTRNPGDAARALAQLESLPITTEPEAQPWADWVRLLMARAAEQKRLDEQITRQAQQLRDGQRRIDQLTEQLEALKAIERSLAPRSMGKAP